MRNHTTPEGKEIGRRMAQWADDAEPKARLKVPELPPRCASCAFRDGPHLASGSPHTQMDALKCLVEGIEFQCHDIHRQDTPCSGWAMLMLAKDDDKFGKVPWDFSSMEEKSMTDWFTDKQVDQVARDLQENDRTMADAMDFPSSAWGELSGERQKYWLDQARARLAAMVPIDITRPLKMRDGTPVTAVRLSDDGLQIIATAPAWASPASWPITGSFGEADSVDLVYADV